MRVLVNASNIHVGGGTQVALSFINFLYKFPHFDFIVLASDKVYNQLEIGLLPINVRVEKGDFGIKQYLRGNSKQILKLEEQISPDIVFTIFGPSYWTPKSPHLMGFAMPWLINPTSQAFKELPFKIWLIKIIQNYIKGYFTKKNAKFFVVETEDVKKRLEKYFNVPLSNTWVADNTYNQHFNLVEIAPSRTSSFFELLTITANYPHKNLRIIKKVIPILKQRGLKVRFTLTIPDVDFNEMFGDEKEYVRNLRPISSKDCPKYYNQADALFLPTLLECFTASYPEAMVMKRPILTSDLPFAKQICGEEGALFFDPLNPVDIVNQIETLVNNEQLYNDLVAKGLIRVKQFLTSEERAEKYISIFEAILNKA